MSSPTASFFECNSNRGDAVAQIYQRCAGIAFDDAMRFAKVGDGGDPRRLEDRNILPAPGIEDLLARRLIPVPAGRSGPKQRLRIGNGGLARLAHAGDGVRNAHRVPHLEGAEFPVEAGAHRAIDAGRLCGNLGQAVGGIGKEAAEQLPLESGCLVFSDIAGHEHAEPLGKRFGVLGQFQRGKLGARRGTVGDGLPVEREPELIAFRVFLLLIEALAGFVAQPATLQHGLHKRRQLKRFAGAGLGEVRHHVGQDVQADHIRQAEATGTRPTDGASGKHIHLFDGEPLLLHQLDGLDHDVDANAIGDEVRGVAGIDHRLAQATVGKIGDGGDGRRIGLGGGDHLEQPHVARRIEEVGTEPGAA